MPEGAGVVNEGYFHTEHESFIRIKAHNLDTPSSWWEVTYKNGTTMYYGHNSTDHTTETDGYINAVGKNGKALLWALSKVEDVHGNYYYVEYEEDADNGDYCPLRITYTKNASHPLPVTCTVRFLYEERTDHGRKYIPSRLDMNKRLHQIIVKCKNNSSQTSVVLRKYRLHYGYSSLSGRSIVTRIEEFKGNNSVVKTTEFEWADSSVHISYKGTYETKRVWQEADIPTRFLPMDFNGDKKTDLVIARGEEDDRDSYKFFRYRGNEDGTLTYLGSYDTKKAWKEGDIPTIFETGDYNGDGKSTIIMIRGETDSSPDQYKFIIYTESIPDQTDQIITIKNNSGGKTTITYKPAPQDFHAVDPAETAYPYIANSSPRHLVTSMTVHE